MCVCLARRIKRNDQCFIFSKRKEKKKEYLYQDFISKYIRAGCCLILIRFSSLLYERGTVLNSSKCACVFVRESVLSQMCKRKHDNKMEQFLYCFTFYLVRWFRPHFRKRNNEMNTTLQIVRTTNQSEHIFIASVESCVPKWKDVFLLRLFTIAARCSFTRVRTFNAPVTLFVRYFRPIGIFKLFYASFEPFDYWNFRSYALNGFYAKS